MVLKFNKEQQVYKISSGDKSKNKFIPHMRISV